MSAVQSHVAFILDNLSKKAVAEIITLFDNTFNAFIEELCKKQNEIDQLKNKLELPQADVNVVGNTMQEKPSVLSSYDDISVNHQTSNEDEPKSDCSTEVTQWDFSDEQQYDFEGITDDSHTLELIEEELENTLAGQSQDPVYCTRSEYDDSELGALEFELKAAELDSMTEEEESATLALTHSQTSEVQHREKSSVPGKKVVGSPRKLHYLALAETTETTTSETNEVRSFPAKKRKRGRKKLREIYNMRCPDCRQVFYRPTDLKKHRFTHKEKELLICEWCGVTFPCKSQMLVHNRIHTGERPFHCHICDRAFICKSQLTTHIFAHKSKEKGESCTLCGANSTVSLEGDTPKRRSSRAVPCAKCGRTKPGT